MVNRYKNTFLEGGINKMSEITGVHRNRLIRAYQKGQLPFIQKVGAQYVVFEVGFRKRLKSGDISE